MKKVLLFFGILFIATPNTFASVLESETSSIKTLEKQGFSQSTLQAVDWSNYRNGNLDGRYVRYYQRKNNGKLGRMYQGLKNYFDPIQDDGRFGDHHIEFSNVWLDNDAKYSSDIEPSIQTENL